MPRKESLRGWVTSQRSRTQSHEQWITFGKDLLQKKANFVLQSWSNPASRKLMRRRPKFRSDPVYYSKEGIPVGEGKWNDILACESFKGDSLSAEISKLVMRLVCRCDQDERETDGAVHWEFYGSKTAESISEVGRAKKFWTRIGFNQFMEEATRWGSSIAWISKNSLL